MQIEFLLLAEEEILLLYKLHKEKEGYFETCLKEQEEGNRQFYIAKIDKKIAGYAQIIWDPIYQPFRKLKIPEIQDVYVSLHSRRQGTGKALIKKCEEVVRDLGFEEIGIGVSVSSEFSQAQRLYIKMGYIPDGGGAVYEAQPINFGEIRPIDKNLCLKLTKSLA